MRFHEAISLILAYSEEAVIRHVLHHVKIYSKCVLVASPKIYSKIYNKIRVIPAVR